MTCPKGLRQSKKGKCVKRCPRGTYKKNNECVTRPKKFYCPPGFSKVSNKCVRNKCPKGSTRKKGICITKGECLPGKYKNRLGRCVKNFHKLQQDIKKALLKIKKHPGLEEKLINAMKKYEHRLGANLELTKSQ